MVYQWRDALPDDSPTHAEVPYAFKAHAINRMRNDGYKQILWADASIVALKALNPIWNYAAEHGVWLANNGWNNAQWIVRRGVSGLS